MNLKSIVSIAAAVVASSAWAAPEAKCGAGTCGKKEAATKAPAEKEAACSKKESAAPKEAACAKKEASCAKKDAACAKK